MCIVNKDYKDIWFKDSYDYQYIYHFTTIDSLLKILVTDNFRLSCVNKMNDRNEALATYKRFNNNTYDEEKIRKEDEFRSRTFLGCFTILEENQSIRDKVSMWGNYAESCKGVCIEIDKKKLDDKLWNMIYDIGSDSKKVETHIGKFKINYKKQSKIDETILNIVNSSLPLYSILENLFNSKSEEWAVENEFRYLVYNNRFTDMDYFNISNFSNVISKIFVGEMQSKDSIKLLKDIKDKLAPDIEFNININGSEKEISSIVNECI